MAKRISLAIQGMECPNCAMRLEGIEDTLVGVLRAEASYQKGCMTVEFDEMQVNEAQIAAAIQRLGYGSAALQPAVSKSTTRY